MSKSETNLRKQKLVLGGAILIAVSLLAVITIFVRGEPKSAGSPDGLAFIEKLPLPRPKNLHVIKAGSPELVRSDTAYQ